METPDAVVKETNTFNTINLFGSWYQKNIVDKRVVNK